jgi:hypothetical protein
MQALRRPGCQHRGQALLHFGTRHDNARLIRVQVLEKITQPFVEQV